MNRARKPQNMIGVHHAGIGLRQRARLPERVHDDELHRAGDPIEARLGTALRATARRAATPPGEERHRHGAADVEQHVGPAGNVPEGVAERHAAVVMRASNDTMGNMAATAEYGSVLPARTSSNFARSAPPPGHAPTRSRELLHQQRLRARAQAPAPPARERSAC